MKNLLCISLMLLTAFLYGGEDVLFFCGGRLYGSNRQKNVLTATGCSVKFHDTRDLAGFGGSIQKYEDKEPEKKDCITPEFEHLGDYKVVLFASLSPQDMEGIMTTDRVVKLRQYVMEGGVLLLDIHTPAALGDLTPVIFDGNKLPPKKVIVERPDYPQAKELPERWTKMTPYRKATAKSGAVVHSYLVDAKDKKIAPCIVSMKYGKGKVIFYNALWLNSSNVGSFATWGYYTYSVRGLLSFALDKPLKNVLKKVPDHETKPALDTVNYSFTELKNELRCDEKVTLTERKATFTNGITITILQDGRAEVRYPGMNQVFRLNAPSLCTTGNPQEINGDSNEAIVDTYDLRPYPITWKEITCSVKGEMLSVLFASDTVRMRWEFKAGTVLIDGRKYVGYADRIVMEKLPIFLESVMFDSVMPNGTLRRTTCYTYPRGYLETKLSNEPGKIDDSKTWQFFCSGQPFTYVYYPNTGIFAEMVDYPIPCYVNFKATSQEELTHSLRLRAGRRKVPAALPFVWHLFSAGKENGNNDYIAIYQFVRQYLRKVCGLKTFPQVTQASFYLHGRKHADLEQSAKVAAELNFKSLWLTLCPLQMTEISGEKLANLMQMTRKHGMAPHPWTPGGYNHKDSNPIFKAHPDWFIRKKSGTFHRYFKTLPVGDFNNPDFRNWFLQQIIAAQKNGMERVYHDMGGEISNQVNYYPPTQSATTNLDGLILLLQEYSKINLPCSIEGMNPLVKDQALLTIDKAYPMLGKEFAYVGGTPLASIDNGQANALYFDYFRLLMFNATINIDVDGYRRNFERIPGELQEMKKISQYNKVFNKAHAFVLNPFVRETSFGSAWIGDKTGALFFEREVKHLKLTLPKGWSVEGNAKLDNIPAHSAVYLRKMQ